MSERLTRSCQGAKMKDILLQQTTYTVPSKGESTAVGEIMAVEGTMEVEKLEKEHETIEHYDEFWPYYLSEHSNVKTR